MSHISSTSLYFQILKHIYMNKLINKVSEHDDVESSVVELVRGIKLALDDAIAKKDEYALHAVSDSLESNVHQFSEAVVKNTILTEDDSEVEETGEEEEAEEEPQEEPQPKQ